MSSTLRRKLTASLLSTPITFCAFAACEANLDDCTVEDNVCDGNVAVHCEPTPAKRRVSTREDCGADRTCVASGYVVVCARKGPVECPTKDLSECRGDVLVQCTGLPDGRKIFVDTTCARGCVTTDARA
jgi:hypothetical protein